MLLGKNSCCKLTNVEQIIDPSGHTALEMLPKAFEFRTKPFWRQNSMSAVAL